MGSSNRHWPSLFKSKPCNHHEFTSPNFSSSPSFKSVPNFPSSPGGADGSSTEERTPEPKPRWNPKPEQIRILEAIFNSGMVNPPREEIKKIRAQLQEYGQVGDANVFYWFQNRKSRSKQKNRQLLRKSTTNAITPQTPPLAPVAPSSSSSSSSDRSSPNKFTNSSSGSVLESPTGHQGGYGFYQHQQQQQQQQNDGFIQQELGITPPTGALPFFFPVPQAAGAFGAGALCFNEITQTPVTSVGGGMFPSFSSVADQAGAMGTFSGLLLGDMTCASKRSMFEEEEEDKMRYEAEELSFMVTSPTNTNAIHIPPTPASPLVLPSLSQFQGAAGEPGGGGRMVVGPAKSTVFINEVSFEVPAVGPFNLREVFGEDVVLLHQSGHPVPTNEWGLTLHPLQHGACYFLVRTLASKHHHHSTTPPHQLFQPSQFPFHL